ncbi:MAG: HesA/MoeB/ThiF family protein [Bacillota bacterium]|nr:HesA/MoeB/ThiF family protein [Bacillota bacterium]
MQEFSEAIKLLAEESISPAGKPYFTISLSSVRSVASQFSCSIKEAEITALKNSIIPERYERSLGTVGGMQGQILLLNSRAAVMGLGGLGGLAAELLARMGVGTLLLIDGDSFSESNLNRQVLATEENLGEKKAEVSRNRINKVNAAVDAIPFAQMATEDNIESLLDGCHVILDCLDNLRTRFLLQETCKKLSIPMIHGAIAQFYGQVSTILPGDQGLNAIYRSFEKGKDNGIEKELGNPATTPALVAAWQVQEAIKLLINKKELLRNRLLFIDTLEGSCETIQLEG